jgi:hypothetical protein
MYGGAGPKATKAHSRSLRSSLFASTPLPVLSCLDRLPTATRYHFLAFLPGTGS